MQLSRQFKEAALAGERGTAVKKQEEAEAAAYCTVCDVRRG